ncbi:hypothetical protein L3V82_08045 [Thiotrichales bacterium 19S3-7]|nr:hypothetical protein [Thiotrichales bacterium 19S3-7]MCF6802111.1 hypothetical protein [Thiotrichales bacterium 19S3-11]
MRLFIQAIMMLLAMASVNITYANNVSDAVAISAGQTAVAVTSGVIMKNMGVEPQYISTPTGIVAVPANNNGTQMNNSDVDQYTEQNNQAAKQAFFDGALN